MQKIDKKELHELFLGLKNKNQNSYNKLYEKYYKLVYGITFSILKNKEDSEDIAHEIFTKIYKLSTEKLPESNEASWLYTVSKNECFLFLRKSKPNISIDEIYEIPAEASEIEQIVDSEYYNKLISGLKDDEKMIVSLKVLSDFSFKKISQVMNTPIGTVQWKYYKAINSIKVSIGSLVGAAMAFILIIARGEQWKKENYFDKNKYQYNEDKDNSTNKNTDIAEEVPERAGENASEAKTNENTSSEIGTKTDKIQQNVDNVPSDANEISSDIKESIAVLDKTETFMERMDVVQVSLLVLGLTFLTIFIIFFKKYQQKLKKKSSK